MGCASGVSKESNKMQWDGFEIELEPSNDEYYSNRALVKESNEDYFGGVIDATRAIELNPENVKAYKLRALNFTLLKSKFDALQCSDYKKCCEWYYNY
tara:strand:- start:167 stop:460 length:294 start_codon:yes stop_codon:yes gene_type:complete